MILSRTILKFFESMFHPAMEWPALIPPRDGRGRIGKQQSASQASEQHKLYVVLHGCSVVVFR